MPRVCACDGRAGSGLSTLLCIREPLSRERDRATEALSSEPYRYCVGT